MRLLRVALWAAALVVLPTAPDAHPTAATAIPGARTVDSEIVEGMVLLYARCEGAAGRDTSGWFVLDSGAGYLAVDHGVAEHLGLSGSGDDQPISILGKPLNRFEIGGFQEDQVAPVLEIDAGIVRQAIDRPVLGLVGVNALRGLAVELDYVQEMVTLIPSVGFGERADVPDEERIDESRKALAPALGDRATPIPFRLLGDGKLVVHARLMDSSRATTGDTMTLIVDTGASKTAFFAPTAEAVVPHLARWLSLRGLVAPTLVGSAPARVTRVPFIEVIRDDRRPVAATTATRGANAAAGKRPGPAIANDMDAVVIESELGPALSSAVGEPVHGLLGHSFLRRFRSVIDIPHRVLWLEPVNVPRDAREYEYSHVGIQIERRGDGITVVGVVEGSSAATAGIRPQDVLLSVDGRTVAGSDLVRVSRLLEGRPGTTVRLVTRRAGMGEMKHRLTRRRLL